MAKRRKKKQSSKCPEPFNTLIDLAGAMAIDYIRYKHRQKNGGRRPKIDPYAATGIAMGMGKINSTEDIIALGGILGAMGAFDEDNYSHPIDNRYAWRLNCIDGSEYGIDPDDYETRDEYNDAIRDAKAFIQDDVICGGGVAPATPPRSTPKQEVTSSSTMTFFRVSRLDDGMNLYYVSPDNSFRVGERVIVPKEDGGQSSAIILSVSSSPPENIENLQEIIGRDE